MGKIRSIHTVRNDSPEKLPVPPGFVSLTSFTLKRMVNGGENIADPIAIGEDLKPESVDTPLSNSVIEKFRTSFNQRPWILHNQSDCAPQQYHSGQTEVVEFEAQLKEEEHFECRITLRCRYSKICEEIMECLNEGEMDALNQSTHFADLIRTGRNFNISAQIIWYMMIRQSRVTKSNELWMIVNGRPLRFSKLEFALLTGLRFSADEQQFPNSDSFKQTHFKGAGDVICKDILQRMQLLKKKKKNEKLVSMPLVQLAALYFAAGVLCPSWHSADAVNNNLIQLASDWEGFQSFPWGNIAYNHLLRNLKTDFRCKLKKLTNKCRSRSHGIGGFVHPLQVLAYEYFPGIATRYVDKKVGDGLPLARMCRWSSSKWNQKRCPQYAAIKSAAEASEDIISCLTPTLEEDAALGIRDGAFEDEWPEPVTQHISELLSRGIKVICSSSPLQPPPSPKKPSTSRTSPNPFTSRTSPNISPPPPPPPPSDKDTIPSTSTSSSIMLRELCNYMDSKFKSMGFEIDARLAQMTKEISRLDETICNFIKNEEIKARKSSMRPTEASDKVTKRRRTYIHLHDDKS